MSKHLIIVHGRATKPKRDEKEQLVKKAMISGLKRIDADAATKIENGQITVTFAYYGHICNNIMVEHDEELKKTMYSEHDPGENITYWYENPKRYDEALDELMNRSADRHTKEEYRRLVSKYHDVRVVDNFASIFSPLLANGLSNRIIRRALPDLGAYIGSRKVGSKIRQCLQEPLHDALMNSDDIAVISHSMGCMATYDILWKFSHMSEYPHVKGKNVSLWMTLGSPLGEPAVRQSLYDSNEPDDGRYPRNIRRWINIAAHDDFVSHDNTAADDFREMSYISGCDIIDLPKIYNYWVHEGWMNPHKFYGYLNHPVMAQQLAKWINN